MASPRTNFEAPSMAPKKPDSSSIRRRLRRASLAALRKEIEPADQRRLAAFLPSWQGVDRHSNAGAGIDRLREVLVPLQEGKLALGRYQGIFFCEFDGPRERKVYVTALS